MKRLSMQMLVLVTLIGVAGSAQAFWKKKDYNKLLLDEAEKTKNVGEDWGAPGGLAPAGDVNKMADYIKKGADVNYVGEYNATPLTSAAGAGNYEAVKLLVEKGATNLNEALRRAMGYAEWGGIHENTFEYLLQKGADPNWHKKPGDQTVTDYAQMLARSGRPRPALLNILQKYAKT